METHFEKVSMRSNSAHLAPHSFLGDQERFELSSATRITEKGFSVPEQLKREASPSVCDKLEDRSLRISSKFIVAQGALGEKV